MAVRDRLVLLGIVVRAHGIQGEVSIRVEDTDLADELVRSERLWFEKDGASGIEQTVASARRTAKGVNLRFEGITDRDAAQKLRGARLSQWRSKFTTVDADELFTGDLLGLEARTPEGAILGKVESLGGAGDVLILEIPTACGELQVPLAAPFIHDIHLEEGHIVLTPPAEFSGAGSEPHEC